MIEQAIKTSLEQLTGLLAYPLLLPDTVMEGVTYQRVSDPLVDTGLVVTSLSNTRFQITLYIVNDYSGILALDKRICAAWGAVVHSDIAGFPVQSVQRAGIQQDVESQTNGDKRYRLARDFIITYTESS